MAFLVKQLIERISGRPAANQRDARLHQIQHRISMTDHELRQRLRLVEERQDIKRRVPDV